MALNFGTPVPRLSVIGKIPQAFKTTLNQGLRDYANRYPWVFGNTLNETMVFGRDMSDEDLLRIPGFINEHNKLDEEWMSWRGPDKVYGSAYATPGNKRLVISAPAHTNAAAKEEFELGRKSKDPFSVGHTFGVKGIRNTLRHEFGHHFTNSAVKLIAPADFGSGTEDEITEAIKEHIYPIVGQHFKTFDPSLKGLFRLDVSHAINSQYANFNPDELMAELFSRSEIKGPGHLEAKAAIADIAERASSKAKMLRGAESAMRGLLDMRR